MKLSRQVACGSNQRSSPLRQPPPCQPARSSADTQGVTTFDAVAVDYAGYCINLAVRLQDHCPPVGFIVHQPLHPHLPDLLPLKALKMKGSLDEPVFVFAEDFERFRAAHPREAGLKFAVP